VVHKLSGTPYSPDDSLTSSQSSDNAQVRSQIDARSIQSRWSSPINYYISTTTGFTALMMTNSKT